MTTKIKTPMSISISKSEADENNINIYVETVFSIGSQSYVVLNSNDEEFFLTKVKNGPNGEKELHDIEDKHEFDSVSEYYQEHIQNK
ncbi:hypothetical protein J2S74_002894 [Evansella vedderi]|uniref:Uncharacterized protein n=1 Tax=Evansella vedderi TaxID=38282 RepID=A0ABT9ZW96_9BACI|nr:DUF1292 domain-containing protein [Evansella vedderi]MDQ0255512.1 hypothetical protein [Evansella vedderi]